MSTFALLLALAAPLVSPPAHAGVAAAPAPEALMHADDEAVRRGFTKTRKTIPLAFQGSFRRTLAECGQATDSALAIGPTAIALPAKDGDVQEVRVEGPRKIVVTSIYEGGGEVWEKTETLLLGRDGRSVAFQLETGPYTRVRCPATWPLQR
jgi:hypothetical protein